MKCCGGTKERSISTSATTIFFDSFLNPSSAAVARATILKKLETVLIERETKLTFHTVIYFRRRKKTQET
jgi:hypothetical protein